MGDDDRSVILGAHRNIESVMGIYRLGFVMEQTLGHVTHDQNMRHWVAGDGEVVAEWLPIPFDAPDRWQRMPGIRGNWSLRASLRALERVRATMKRHPLDGLFFHTQVTALLARSAMRRIPTIVSLDATPLNLDTVGAAYDHMPSRFAPLEALKNALNRRAFRAAKHLVTWCEWAKRSLVDQYGVPAERVTVIPPGIDLGRWRFERFARRGPQPVRLLFVGGDFRRKGGVALLSAFRQGLSECCRLDVVTREEVDTSGLEGVCVHHGLTANSPQLMALYEAADIFVFPTLGDCLPIVVMEAMAAELPVVASRVGALCEEVEEGETGFLIPPGDTEALIERTRRLVEDADLRRQMGWAGRKRAEEKFDGARNYRAVLALCKRCADGKC